MDDRPRRSEYESTRGADGTMTVTTPAGTVVSLNAVAAAIWELCDGSTSVSEIVEAATTLFSGSPEEIERDIVAALDDLQGQRLITYG